QHKAEVEKQKKEEEAEKARQVSGFLAGMFDAADPIGVKGFSYYFPAGSPDLKVREVLDRGAAQIRQNLKLQPSVRATQMETIGSVYRSLGLYKEAGELLNEAYELRKKAFGPEHPEVAASLYNLGWLYHEQGKFPLAREYYLKSLKMRRQLLGDDDP